MVGEVSPKADYEQGLVQFVYLGGHLWGHWERSREVRPVEGKEACRIANEQVSYRSGQQEIFTWAPLEDPTKSCLPHL